MTDENILIIPWLIHTDVGGYEVDLRLAIHADGAVEVDTGEGGFVGAALGDCCIWSGDKRFATSRHISRSLSNLVSAWVAYKKIGGFGFDARQRTAVFVSNEDADAFAAETGWKAEVVTPAPVL